MTHYKKIKQELKTSLLCMIREGSIGSKKLFPEARLATLFGCSVSKIREVLIDLEQEGFISKRQGSGNYIHHSAFNQRMRIDLIHDYTALLNQKYSDVSTRSYICETLIDGPLQFPLHCNPDEKYLSYVRQFLVGNLVAIHVYNCVPMGLLKCAPEDCIPGVSIFDFLRIYAKQDVAQNALQISSVSCPEDIAGMFNVLPGRAITSWQETIYNVSDDPIAYSQSFFHPELTTMSLIIKR